MVDRERSQQKIKSSLFNLFIARASSKFCCVWIESAELIQRWFPRGVETELSCT